MTDKPKRKPFHEEFAEKIIESLQAGTAPWQRPWHPGVHLTPHNPVSGTVYKGVNRISLSMCGHDDPRWMTFKQANDQGMSIMSGSKSRPVVYYQFTKEEDRLDEDGKPVLGEDGKVLKKTVELERPIMRFISVFNAEQIKGMPPLQLTDKPFEWDPVEKAEGILAASGAVIKHDQSDRAFYRPSTDSIHLPPRANFEDAGKYYSTAIHELGHWTGHSSRLDRGFEPFGEGYAREELRAEIASWMLGQDIGIGHDPGQHAAYVASWIKALKDDPFEIMRACRDAESIKEYVMGFGLERQVEQQLARDRELDGHGLEGPEDIAHEHAAAMYRSQAETVEEFVNSIPQHGNIQKSVFHLRSVNGNPVELATDQVRHIRSHHPDFNEWERIPDIVEHGRTIPVGIDKFTNSPTKIYILEEGDKSFVVIGASVSGSQRKEGHIARTVTLTAFHDDTTKVLHWASRHEKENALSPSDVNQTTSRADGYSSLPRSADAEHPTNLFRDGVPVSINELDEEVNGFLQERTKERAITYSSAGRTPASSPAREGAALSNLSDGLEKKLKTFDEEVNEILGRTRDEEKTFLAHEHAAAMYKAEDPSISDFARRVGQEEKQHKSYFGLMPDQGVFSGIEVILPSDSVKHRDKRHPDMTDQDMDRLSQVLAALTPEQACLPQNDVPRFSGKGILAWAVVNGQAYGLILESVSPERVIIASYFKDHENTVRAWFEQEGDIKKAVMTPAALWPAQASKEDVLHDQPSEERIAEPPVEVKANLGAAKEKTFLEVPYAEKDQAKKLGAQWDRQKKSWFAPAGADLRRLGQWLPKEQSLADQSLDAAGELAKAITAMGGDLQGARPALNGKVHRLPAIDRPAGNKDFAYCAYADGLPAGWMQNHATGEKSNWKFSGGHELTEEQKLLLRSEADQQREARRREQDMARDAVAKDCAAYFADRSPAASDHPYLAAKGVEALGIKESETGRDLLVPLLNLKGEIRSLQRIHENGFKSFQAGAEKKGNFFLLGCEFNELARQKEVLIAEGYATAASLHMATRLPCVVAFGADNLMPAAENIRSLLPDAAIVICADNDHSHSMGNIGVLKAKAAAEKIKGRLIIPFLTPDERKAGCKDFNDIHQRRGLGAVKKQVEAGLGKSRSYESVLGF